MRRSGRRKQLLRECAKQSKKGAANYALELYAQGKYDEALAYLRKTEFPAVHGSMNLTLAHIHSRCARARQAMSRRDYKAARKDLAACLHVQHNFNEDVQELNCLAEAYCLLGELEEAQGRSGKAKEYYQKAARETHGLQFPLKVWQAVGLLKSGRPEEGRQLVDRFEKLVKHRLALAHDFHAHYHYLYAVLLCARGDKAGYRRELERRGVGLGGIGLGFPVLTAAVGPQQKRARSAAPS